MKNAKALVNRLLKESVTFESVRPGIPSIEEDGEFVTGVDDSCVSRVLIEVRRKIRKAYYDLFGQEV